MEKLKLIIIALIGFSLSSCIKSDQIPYSAPTQLEWDAATYNANALSVTYPILTRVPGYGRAALTADPSITRTSGTIKFRVNLVGPQQSSDIVVNYIVLPVSTAVSGTHYTTTGTFTILANTSFGEVTVNVLNPGPTTTGAKILVLELVPPDGIIANANDKDLGISIAQN